ncbi:lactosylceramide 4-alpha-galactosyltransferase-like [Anticarsia gemmatalis]|uniref:lactosylceramide 4-alpha-galactosyltransferase-like n=1 Tax=Anticarsia gemmatalis TaxID=129554 RepID=UPI003F759C15
MIYKLFKNCGVKKKIIILFVLFQLCCVTIVQLNWTSLDDISCHYSSAGDALPLIDEAFAPPPTSIHFHETSCKGWLNSRQACAIESAARAHPNWQINVFFTGPVTKEHLTTGVLNTLNKHQNVKFFRINLIEFTKSTPLEVIVSGGALNKSLWRVSHTSDMLRYLSLYKWGGVYLDLDVIVAKSFEDLSLNWAARESDTGIGSAMLAISKDDVGRTVANATIREFSNNFRGDDWGHNGPGVITRVLQNICATNDIGKMSSSVCKGFEVYPAEMFCPIKWTDAKLYFGTEDLQVKEPYTYHVWNKVTEGYQVDRRSVYANLAKKYCPTMYESHFESIIN